jgi:hypothetical protein
MLSTRYTCPCGHFPQGRFAPKANVRRFLDRNCEIDFPKEWKVVSTHAGRMIPDNGQFMVIGSD